MRMTIPSQQQRRCLPARRLQVSLPQRKDAGAEAGVGGVAGRQLRQALNPLHCGLPIPNRPNQARLRSYSRLLNPSHGPRPGLIRLPHPPLNLGVPKAWWF